MGKDKLKRFAENKIFGNVFEPTIGYPPTDLEIKGNWRSNFFNNDNPIVLELGCGRGEYTINLARKFPMKNFIGFDRKGARIWRGAKTAIDENLNNVAFIRNEIQFLHTIFAVNEIDEIWITFPDPHPPQGKQLKRLTSPRFFDYYHQIVKPNSTIHLKTDYEPLYNYTREVIDSRNYETAQATNDLYHSDLLDEVLSIRTAYEQLFLKKGSRICYIKFRI